MFILLRPHRPQRLGNNSHYYGLPCVNGYQRILLLKTQSNKMLVVMLQLIQWLASHRVREAATLSLSLSGVQT